MNSGFAMVFILLAACGSAGPSDCFINGLEIHMETGASCEDAADNLEFAQRLLAKAGIVRPGTFETVYAGLRVEVLDLSTLGDSAIGRYTWGEVEGIKLTRSGRALFHELIHAKERRAHEIPPGVDSHAHWEAAGYVALDEFYRGGAKTLHE